MAEFTLPANSKVGTGKTYPAPAGAKRVQDFKIYRWNPDDGQNPRLDTYEVDLDAMRADGPGRADQDQERGRHHADLPPLLPRRHLRLLRDEHRRHQHARLPQADRGREGRRQNLSAAAYAGGEGSRARSQPASTRSTARSSRGCKSETPPPPDRERLQSVEERAEARRAVGMHPVLLLLDRAARATGGTATAISARPSCCRPIAGSPTAATSTPASGSMRSKIRSGSIAATPS